MKLFFGTDKTFDKENEAYDGQALVVEGLPQDLQKKLDDNAESVKKHFEKVKKPLFLIKLGIVFGISSAIGRFASRVLFDIYEAPVISYIANGIIIALLLATIVLVAVGMNMSNKVIKGKEATDLADVGRAIQDECMQAMGVPADTTDVELFSFDYINNNGNIKILNDYGYEFYNTDYKAYVENDSLCIIELPYKYGIPLESVTAIKRVDEKVSFYFWNKKTPHNKGEFAQYKIKYNKSDSVYLIKYYYSLEINHNGEEYFLYFPPYELETIEKLTGLKVAL